MGETKRYLSMILPPVIHCFEDPESRVRYYACESLFNITKVSRLAILDYFNDIFDGLCKLYADVDMDVRNGANMLNRLIKDVRQTVNLYASDLLAYVAYLSCLS